MVIGLVATTVLRTSEQLDRASGTPRPTQFGQGPNNTLTCAEKRGTISEVSEVASVTKGRASGTPRWKKKGGMGELGNGCRFRWLK